MGFCVSYVRLHFLGVTQRLWIMYVIFMIVNDELENMWKKVVQPILITILASA
jgi:hypothetical protein